MKPPQAKYIDTHIHRQNTDVELIEIHFLNVITETTGLHRDSNQNLTIACMYHEFLKNNVNRR